MTPYELANFAERAKSTLRTDYTTLFEKTRQAMEKMHSREIKTGLEWSLARLHTDLVNMEESFDRYISYLTETHAGTKI